MSLFQPGFDWQKYSTIRDNPATNRSGTSSPYLDLPHTTRCDRPVPFKALESDTISLSMKKRHHRRHSLSNIEGEQVSAIGTEFHEDNTLSMATTELAHSKSLPSFFDRHELLRQDSLRSCTRIASESTKHLHQRRWTLPSKATPTQGLSVRVSVFKHRENHRQGLHKQSPAMITLRRATNGLDRRTSITFFPPPKFNGPRTSLMSYFLRAVAGDDHAPGVIYQSDVIHSLHDNHVTSTYPLSNRSCVAETGPVEPTITEVGIESILSPAIDNHSPTRLRRCSTRYVTENSSYEVIWDENDTPSVSSSSTPRQRQHSDIANRRQSAAVTQLEAQLFKSVAQSRRASSAVVDSEAADSRTMSFRRKSFQSMLNLSFSRLMNESALWNLPRSKAARGPQRSNSFVPAAIATHQATDDRDDSVAYTKVDFFPPLRPLCMVQAYSSNSSVPYMSKEEDESDKNRSHRAWTNPEEQSTEGSEDVQELPGRTISARNSSPDEVSALQAYELHQPSNDDVVPLLDTFRWGQNNLW